MKSISTFDLRNNLSSYLEKVTETESPIIVTRRNKPLVVITPYKGGEVKEDFTRFIGFLGDDGETGEEYENRVRRSPAEKKYVELLRKGIVRRPRLQRRAK